MKRWFVLGSLAATAGCAEREAVEGRELDPQAIYGGSLPTEWYHEATVAITTYNNAKRNIFCTGTLISSDVVLTAAHCMDEASWASAAYNEYEPGDIKVGFGDRKRVMTFETVSDVEIYSSYDRQALENDIALIRLTNASAVAPVPNLPYALLLDPAADVGADVNFAGYGLNDQGYNDATKLQVDGTISTIGATTVEYDQQAGGPCSGDSGGPMFIERSGDWYVAGVTSWGSSSCSGNGAFGVSTAVDVFENWILAF